MWAPGDKLKAEKFIIGIYLWIIADNEIKSTLYSDSLRKNSDNLGGCSDNLGGNSDNLR